MGDPEGGFAVTIDELFDVKKDSSKLKSLYLELEKHDSFHPYRCSQLANAPNRSDRKNFIEWHAAEKERIEKEIEQYKERLQYDRKRTEDYIATIPYPECDIIRYRVINGLGWFEIGEMMNMNRRTASRKFYGYFDRKT